MYNGLNQLGWWLKPEILAQGDWMLMKDTMAIIDHWSIPINFRGSDIWFDLSMSLYKVKGH